MRKALVVSLLGVVTACGAKHEQGPGGGDAVDAAVGGACAGSADCAVGQFCSGNRTCIDDGLCKVDVDCDVGKVCGADGTCGAGACGGTHLDLTYVAPNFIIALDRSCSMKQKLDGQTTKWDAAVAALNHVLEEHAADIRWGATLFPDTTGASCAQDAIPFPVGDGTAPGIEAVLTGALATTDPLYPQGPCVTNIDSGLAQAATDPALADAARSSFVMLVTDGAQSSCAVDGGADGATATIRDLFQTRGIPTFVVGFGAEVDADQMTKFAQAGGMALPGPTKYYQADTADALDAAFQQIAGLTVSCKYTVDPAPDNLDEMYVYFGTSELVPRDQTHTLGWDYSPNSKTLTLYGDDCTRLQTHAVTNIDVLFGCPTPPIQ